MGVGRWANLILSTAFMGDPLDARVQLPAPRPMIGSETPPRKRQERPKN